MLQLNTVPFNNISEVSTHPLLFLHPTTIKSKLLPPKLVEQTTRRILSSYQKQQQLYKLNTMVSTRDRKKGLLLLKLFIKKLQNHLQISRNLTSIRKGLEFEEVEEKETVPEDVKEGYFAVIAAKNEKEEPMRFVVDLCVLKHPAFLKLLKMAEEEYGFQQKGALSIPCRADELQRILQDKILRTIV